MIWLNAKILRRTRQNIQEDDLRKREHYSAHGLRIAFIRIFALLIIMFITVRYADLKLFWGVVLLIYAIGFVGSAWLMTKRLPSDLPKISNEQVNREYKAKWWSFAFQFVLMIVWLYSWKHLYL